MRISIIIPALNEEKTIKDVILDFHKELPQAHIYVIDNCSTDKTGQIAKETLKSIRNGGKVLFESRRGKANAIRSAFSKIDSDIYIMVDADLTYPAKDVHALLNPVMGGAADITVGDRLSGGRYFRENKRMFHNFGNNLVKVVINSIFKSKLNDIMSGYRVLTRRFVKNYPILVEGFELETDLTLHALDKRFTIVEIPIEYIDRPLGSESKLNTIEDGYKVIKTIIKLYKNYQPFSFFSLLALMFLLMGAGAGFPVIYEYVQTQYIRHVPLAILATGLMISSLLFFSIGIVLSTVVKIHKYEFERQLLNYTINSSY